jgi:xylan 1,4-beta-xylosidase
VIFRSHAVTGPYEPWSDNPILTQRDLDPTRIQPVTCTGHADMVIGPDENWWAVFLGCRPYADDLYATGRETFMLPVTWTQDGWPRVLPHGEPVSYVAAGPGIVIEEPKGEPLSGNFTWRDDFDSATLPPRWIMLRRPHETWWKLDAANSRLLLTPQKEVLSGSGNPSYLGRRVQHAHFVATTRLTVPESRDVSAGLVVFQNETHHFFLAVRRTKKGATVSLERWNGEKPDAVAQQNLTNADQVDLRMTIDGGKGSFAFADASGAWVTLASDVDATNLTTKVAGGFVGSTVGVHARIEAH